MRIHSLSLMEVEYTRLKVHSHLGAFLGRFLDDVASIAALEHRHCDAMNKMHIYRERDREMYMYDEVSTYIYICE